MSKTISIFILFSFTSTLITCQEKKESNSVKKENEYFYIENQNNTTSYIPKRYDDEIELGITDNLDEHLYNPNYKAKGKIINNKREGIWKIYHPKDDNIIIQANYENGLLNGVITIYSIADSTILLKTSYVKGLRQGKLETFDFSGSLLESLSYKNGLLHGESKTYKDEWETDLSSSKKYLQKSYNFLNGKRHGACIVYQNSNGDFLQDYSYKNGTLISRIDYYPKSQNKQLEILYNEESSMVELKGYYENGNLQYIGTRKIIEYPDEDGFYVGEFKYFHENGKIQRKRLYNEEGKKIKEWKYDENGNLIEN